MRRPFSNVGVSLALFTAIGCAQNVAEQMQPAPVRAAHVPTEVEKPVIGTAPPVAPNVGNQFRPALAAPPSDTAGLDPRLTSHAMIDLHLYRLSVPVGSVSLSREFWKRIEEPVVDVATYDLLFKNGVRVGEGNVSDWSHFKEIFDRAGVSVRHEHYMAHAARDQELAMSEPMPEQLIFFFDQHGLTGKVFDGCRNVLAMTFEPAPRKENTVRLQLCPIVEAMRHHYEYTALNNEQMVEFKIAEQLYDLNLRADIPSGRFLIVAPSKFADDENSIGHQFLTHNGHAGRTEQILLFVANASPEISDTPPGTTTQPTTLPSIPGLPGIAPPKLQHQ